MKTIQNNVGITAIACIVMFFIFIFADLDFTIHRSKESVNKPGGGEEIRYDDFNFSELLLYLFFFFLVILAFFIVFEYLIKGKDEDDNKGKGRY